ncbi:MAG TPA: CBS domain-containing protein [Flavisolibacter sp.]|jgi:CBS domain-containing protein|nr:CBS domain-containing protein [Flavisolibacter sp.]
MNTVNHILSRKGASAISVTEGTSVFDALKLMAEKNIGSVVVNGREGAFSGIVTERDYSRKVILQGKSSTETTVEEIMSTDLPKLSLSDSVEHCMQLMTSKNIRYLPVFAGTELKGIISMSDVVKETILMQQETISHLKEYINQ